MPAELNGCQFPGLAEWTGVQKDYTSVVPSSCFLPGPRQAKESGLEDPGHNDARCTNQTITRRTVMMKQADVAGIAGLAALAICDSLIKELHRKNVLSSDEIRETLDTAIKDVEDKGEKGGSAAKLISHLQSIFD